METGGAQGQAKRSAPAPSTGYDFLDRALGKGKYANASGLYNNWNNPFDTLITGENALRTNLADNANLVYNGTNHIKNENPQNSFEALSAAGTPDEAKSGLEKARPVLVSDINALGERLEENGGIDLSDPGNKDAVRVVQKLTGLPEDGEWTPGVMNRLQDYLASEFDQFDGNTYQLTSENLQTLKDIYWSDFYKKQDAAKEQTESYGFSGGGFGGGGSNATEADIELTNLKKRYETEVSINLEDPKNREALHVVQRLAGVDESNTISDDLLKVLQNYMTAGRTDFDFDDYSLTRDNFYTLLEVVKDVKKNPQIDKDTAKAIGILFEGIVDPPSAFIDVIIEQIYKAFSDGPNEE